MSSEVSGLVDLAYSAAVDDALWREWTEALIDQLGSPGALFYLIDPDRFDMCRNYMCFRDKDNEYLQREYLSGPVADDPQMHRVCAVKRSEIYVDTDHVDLDDPRTREYLAWQESNCGTRHHITASVVLPDGLEAGVSVHFSCAQGVPSEHVRRQMRTVFPHFARALRLGFRHAEAIQQSWWDGLSEDYSKPMLLIDEIGRVLRSTPAAENVFRREDGLTVRGGMLRSDRVENDEELRRAVARACNRLDPAASALRVHRAHGRRAYSVTVYPLVQRRRFMVPYGAAALVTIDDPSALPRGLPVQHKQMLGFTEREGQVVDLLLAGHSLESVSANLVISQGTARSHLKSIFRKTGTSRQAELLSFMARLG